jgi:hypothetical protein
MRKGSKVPGPRPKSEMEKAVADIPVIETEIVSMEDFLLEALSQIKKKNEELDARLARLEEWRHRS